MISLQKKTKRGTKDPKPVPSRCRRPRRSWRWSRCRWTGRPCVCGGKSLGRGLRSATGWIVVGGEGGGPDLRLACFVGGNPRAHKTATDSKDDGVSARTACTHATDIDSPALLLHRLFAFVLADLDHPLFALAASLIRIGGFLEALLARFRARRRAKHRATSGSRKRRVNRFRRAQPVSARRTSEVYGASWTKRKCGGGPSPCQLRGGSLPHEKNFVRFLGQAVVAFQHTTERRRRRRLL
jgi:hypothetical protein